MRRERWSRNWRTILRVALRMSGADEEKKTEHRARACGPEEAQVFHGELAADVYGAEIKDDVPAGGGPAKTQHRAETREKKNLVKLMAQGRTRRT